MQFWLRKYEDLFGITKLSELQQRVLEVQNQVQATQERRRQVQDEIFRVQKKLQEMNDILHKMSLVMKLIKEQKRLQNEFTLSDQTERELQTTLALAINNSQDHERTYREKNKYLSLITGVVGGLLGLIGSSINNWRHRKDIKIFAGDISNQVTNLQNAILKLNTEPSTSSQAILKEVPRGTEDLLSEMKIQQEILQENINTMKSLFNDNILQNCDAENKFYGDIQTKKLLFQLEDNISSKLNYHTSLNISLLSSLIIIGTLILFFSNSH
ncbi:hypothetical protein HNY73_018655 [Argiope bruennichi]|uniref:Uncharacterized protein n=1 Tax=Argiope bruennichi TaxID=94029 RepID=A0A8T0EGZ0_ARGBR|nr:hypothetical protein HNY73_018655 [Argiope bruennichi]